MAASVLPGSVIEETTAKIEPWLQEHTRKMVDRVKRGERDVYC